MKNYPPCSFRIEEEGKEICEIAISPSTYYISPTVCNECSIQYPACKYLKAEILLGEKSSGIIMAQITYSRCSIKNIPINRVTFEECINCSEFKRKKHLPNFPIDALTKLYKKVTVDKILPSLFSHADSNLSLSVIFFDIDHFKMVNDNYGHSTGDIVLSETSRVISAEIGQLGYVFRFGGEEILAVLPNIKIKNAKNIAERVRQRVSYLKFNDNNNNKIDLEITISSGVSEFPKNKAKSPIELIEQADKALYRSKEEGRNRVSLFDLKFDSDENLQTIEVDFYGQPPFSKGNKINISNWIPYQSNPKKIMAIKLIDTRTNIESYPGQEKLQEIELFLGKSIPFSFECKIENIKISEKRSVLLVKLRKNIFNNIIDRSIEYFLNKIKDIDNNIEIFKNQKNKE